MPHERNEERRRGIGFQEVLKSIREPFLTLVFSRNDCSEILEIFFFFPFSPFSFFFFRDPLSLDSRVLHTEIILLILLLPFFQYFFFFSTSFVYIHTFRFFVTDESSSLIIAIEKRKKNEFEASKTIPRKYYSPRSIPSHESFRGEPNETNNDQSLV